MVDGYAIAYQVLGRGREDLVYLPAYVSNVELQWDVPAYASFLDGLASICRLILLDTRGHGCSDRLPPEEAPTLEDSVADILAVMEAASTRRATLFAAQEGAFYALLAAAAHPDRISRLVLFGATPSWSRSDDLPDEWSADRWEAEQRSIERTTALSQWVELYARDAAPALMADERSGRGFRALLANTSGMKASMVESQMLSQVDLRHLLPSVKQPTLVIRRRDDPLVSETSSRYLAEHLPDGRLVECPGVDVLPWLGETAPILEEIASFLGHEILALDAERYLATVLFTDLVDSTASAAKLGDHPWKELVQQHHSIVRQKLAEYRGSEVDTAGDGFYATFDGPARAISCARAISDSVHELGLRVRVGIHTGECELIDSKPGGVTVSIGARIAALAGPSEVLISQTVRDLVAGSGLTFEDAGEHELKGIPDRWRLYRVVS